MSMSIDFASAIGGRYEPLALLGQGGMADVYRATDTVLGREVAVKVLRAAANESDRERFIAEGHILAGLSHPGLVTLLDIGMHAEQPFLVMELVEGTTLADLADAPMEPTEVARIGQELAEALDAAHTAGIVHRDVKPGNVLLRGDGRVALFDFGIAKLVGSLQHHTAPGLSLGTAAYLAPEQVNGEDLVPAADIYALGLVLLELLTGARVYPGPPLEAAVARLTRPAEVPDWLSVDWQRLLRRMTATEVAVRPSAAAVADALRAIRNGRSVESTLVELAPATATLPAYAASRAGLPKALLVAGLVAVLTLLLAGAGFLLNRPGQTPVAEAEAPAQGTTIFDALVDDLHSLARPLIRQFKEQPKEEQVAPRPSSGTKSSGPSGKKAHGKDHGGGKGGGKGKKD